MKNLRLIYVASLASLLACHEDFLNLSPEDQLTAQNFYQSPQQMEQAVIAAYDALQAAGQYGFNFTYFMEVRSDNTVSRSITNSGGIYGDFELFRLSPLNPLLDETWKSCYEGIQRCNIVLNRIDGVDMDAGLAEARKAEMKFLRALTYYNLVRIWGAVPLVLEEIDDPFAAFAHQREESSLIYQQIIKDLEEADKVLPVSYPPTEQGRVTRWAALTLLGKVHLDLQDFARSISTLEKVRSSDVFSLLNDYSQLFEPGNAYHQESIFEVNYLKGAVGEGSSFANSYAVDNTTIGGIGRASADNVPTAEQVAAYASGDLRKWASVDTTVDGKFFVRKFLDTPFQENDADNNFPVLRYADVLLMLAEAYNEQTYEPDGPALQYLNAIRLRAGLSAYLATDLADQSSFRQAVREERRLELAFENHRWFDLLRWEVALETMKTKNSPFGALNINPHQLLYPIPQSQIDTSPDNIKQNNGY